ncbi:MAG: heme ABC exporter ATP-binding protein CcmA [Pseudomonadota bacterium]
MTFSFSRHSEIGLSAQNISCVRGGRLVFAGVSFAIAAGEALVLRGRNGIGKSSLLRMIAGLVPVHDGQFALEGADGDIDLAQLCHYFGHLDAIKPVLSVAENLRFWGSYLALGPEFEPATGYDTQTALDAVGIGTLATLPAGYLSAGQRRRLALARLLVAPRPIWLLDEPTSALDTEGQGRLFAMVEAHLSAGGLIVAATHADLPFEIETLDLTSYAENDIDIADLAS